MGRLSIEISGQQHQQIKALAALRGISIKDYILEATLPAQPMKEEEVMAQLEAWLAPRLEAAKRGEISKRSVTDIIRAAKKKRKANV